jgi:hypothetical protein
MAAACIKRPGAIPAFLHLRGVIVRESGRSSTPRLLDSISDGGDYWMPAFAGMTCWCAALLRRVQCLAQGRIVRVALGAAAVERRLVKGVERRTGLEPLDQIRI